MTRNLPDEGTGARRPPVRLDPGSAGAVREVSTSAGDAVTERTTPPPDASVGGTGSTAGVMVGIPAYNESDSIAEVVAAAKRHADAVVVVDDGSDDETVVRALEAGVTVVTHDANRGYGATLQTIFRHALVADVDHLVTLDGDGQHDPADIPKLVGELRAGDADIVVGSRFVDGSETRLPAYRRVGLAVVNWLTNAGIRLRYSATTAMDTQSGFRAYSREATEAVVRNGDLGAGMGASLDLLFHAAREGLEVEEVATTVDYDIDDPSTQNPIAHGLVLCRSIFREAVPARIAQLAVVSVVALLVSLVAVGTYTLFEIPVARSVVLFLVGFVAALGLVYTNATGRMREFTDR